MGAFLTNYQVRCDSAAAVRDAVAGLVKARAYVSPPKNGWVTVYDEASDEQSEDVIRALGAGLAKKLKTVVISFLVHDSDVLAYWVFERGDLLDEFNSRPDYFDRAVDEAARARLRGNPDVLMRFCAAGTSREQVAAVLHPSDGGLLFQEQTLVDLGNLLGIDDARIRLGFTYFDQEGADVLPDAAEFEPVGRQAERKEAKSEGQADDLVNLDPFVIAAGLLGVVWGRQRRDDPMDKKSLASMEWLSRDALKRSRLPGIPSFEELKQARDAGPEAFAELLARRTPAQITAIAAGAAANQEEEFIEALLRHGLDPNATDFRGVSALRAAEVQGTNTRTYQLLKAAADAGRGSRG